MLSNNIRSILIPLKTDENWPTIRLVKALLYPLVQPKSGDDNITVILSSIDQSQCEATNRAIEDATTNGRNVY